MYLPVDEAPPPSALVERPLPSTPGPLLRFSPCCLQPVSQLTSIADDFVARLNWAELLRQRGRRERAVHYKPRATKSSDPQDIAAPELHPFARVADATHLQTIRFHWSLSLANHAPHTPRQIFVLLHRLLCSAPGHIPASPWVDATIVVGFQHLVLQVSRVESGAHRRTASSSEAASRLV